MKNSLQSLASLKDTLALLQKEAKRFNEPLSKREGEVALVLLRDGYLIRVFSNLLFGGIKEWYGSDLSKLLKKANDQVSKLVTEELAFPRNFFAISREDY